MAASQGAIPSAPAFDWSKLTAAAAAPLLSFSFEKSDAREKYGGEVRPWLGREGVFWGGGSILC